MKSYERDVKDVGKVEYVEFDSLHDFKSYIMSTPINNAFKNLFGNNKGENSIVV